MSAEDTFGGLICLQCFALPCYALSSDGFALSYFILLACSGSMTEQSWQAKMMRWKCVDNSLAPGPRCQGADHVSHRRRHAPWLLWTCVESLRTLLR